MTGGLRICYFAVSFLSITITGAGVGNSPSIMVAQSPEQEVQKMLQELCDIAGYGIHSGIHPGPRTDEAANYILSKLQGAGLTNARLEPVKVNNVFPSKFAMTVEVDGEKARSVSGISQMGLGGWHYHHR